MKSNFRQGRRSGTIAKWLTVAIVFISMGALVPARAKTSPAAFPSPTTFASATNPTFSTVAVATGDFNGDGKLDVVNVDSGSNINGK
jgi:FG-GAP repeat